MSKSTTLASKWDFERSLINRKELNILYSIEPVTSQMVIGHQLVLGEEIARVVPSLKTSLVIITDSHLTSSMAPSLQRELIAEGFDTSLFSFPAGETSKIRSTKERLEDLLIQKGLGRDCVIIGFGGGVVTDMAGFVAATYCRGVPFIAIPTTLMGMVDASIGGKTAINISFAKNKIGAFYPPLLVAMDIAFLSTLSDHHLQEGLSEIIKHALIASPELFALLFENPARWRSRDIEFLRTLIEKSCAVKISIIERDPREKGLRRILNFGHTLGHALESSSGYRLSHGMAVAKGMEMESRLSYELGLLPLHDLEKIEELYSLYPFSFSSSIESDLALRALEADKKNVAGEVRVVTLDTIGKASYHQGDYCIAVERKILAALFQEVSA